MINARTFQDETPLFLAVSFEQVACTQWLLESGADPDISNKEKETPLYTGTMRQKSSQFISYWKLQINVDIKFNYYSIVFSSKLVIQPSKVLINGKTE